MLPREPVGTGGAGQASDRQRPMLIGATRWPSRRHAMLAIVVALHAGVAVLLLRPTAPSPRAPAAAALAVREIAVAAPPAVAVAALPPIGVELAPPAITIVTDPGPPRAVPCQLPAQLSEALAGDPAVVAVLAVHAVDRRAIMLWDGRWTADAAPVVRARIAATIAATSAACIAQASTGPQLLFVPVASSIVTLAIGSGYWNWTDLLSDGGN